MGIKFLYLLEIFILMSSYLISNNNVLFSVFFYCKRDNVNVIWAYVRFYDNVFKDSFESEAYESI